jgi:hypothetical protein
MIVVLALCVLTLSSVAFSQKQVDSLHPEGKKDNTLKLTDTTRTLKRQGTASSVSTNKVRINSNSQKPQVAAPDINDIGEKNIVKNISYSSSDSHGSEDVPIKTNWINHDSTILELNNFADTNNDNVPDGWNSNTPTAVQFAMIADRSHQLAITCQDAPVYILKYFEVNAGTEYEIFLTYSGQESDLTVEEFSANNQPIVGGIQQTLLTRAMGKQFTMKFRTRNETRRMFFKIEVSSTGTFVLHKLLFQPVEILRRDGQ